MVFTSYWKKNLQSHAMTIIKKDDSTKIPLLNHCTFYSQYLCSILFVHQDQKAELEVGGGGARWGNR